VTNLKWVLVTAPDDKGNARLNIAAVDGGQVALNITGLTAAEIAMMLIEEMHFEETQQGETVH
jgi:hypothetical protein